MTPDAQNAQQVFQTMLRKIEQLKAEPQPIPHGKAKHYQSFLVSDEAIQKLYLQDDANWLGYAACMDEFRELMNNAQVVAFVPKH